MFPFWRRRDNGTRRDRACPCTRRRAIPSLETLEDRTQPSASVAVGANVDISRLPGNQHESSISIDPANPQWMFAAATQEGIGNYAAYSRDGGATWTGRTQGVGIRDGMAYGGGDVHTAWDSYGNLFLTYLTPSKYSRYVIVGVSTDGGQTFKELPIWSDAKFGDYPSIAVGNGSVWVSYTDAFGYVVAAGAAVTGLGQIGAFAPSVVPGSHGGNFGDIAVGPAGQVLVSYQHPLLNPKGPDTISVNINPIGLGGVFGNPVAAAVTQVGGWDTSVPAQPSSTGIDAMCQLAWDRSGGPHRGRCYLAYVDAPSPSSSATDIFTRYSDDNGASWSVPARVTDDPGTNSKFLPTLSVDPITGIVGVAWYDTRNDVGQGGPDDPNGVANDCAQVWAAFSRDGGATYEPNFRISAGTSFAPASGPPAPGYRLEGYGDWNASDFFAGRFFRIWADNSNSTGDNPAGALHSMDVYTAQVTVSVPIVTPNSAEIADSPTLVIDGTGFSDTLAGNKVTFNLGAVGAVISASPTRLVVKFASMPSPGILTATVSADGTVGIATQVATVVSIGLSPLPDWTQGRPFAPKISASGGSGPFRFSVGAGLPPGLTLNGDGSFSGSPTHAGTFRFTVTAAESAFASGSRSYAMTIHAPPTVSGLTTTAWTEGKPGFSGQMTISDGTPGFAVVGVPIGLPSGLTLRLAGTVLSFVGVPSAAGIFRGSVTLVDAAGSKVVKTFAIVINPPIAFAIASLPPYLVGIPYYVSLQGTSGGTGSIHFSYSLSAPLPAGIVLVNGVLSGMTRKLAAIKLTIAAIDSVGAVSVEELILTGRTTPGRLSI